MTSTKIDPPPQIFNLLFEYVSRFSSWRLRKDVLGVYIIDIYPISGSWSASASLLLGFESPTSNPEQIDIYSKFRYTVPYLLSIFFVALCCLPLTLLVALINPVYGIGSFILLTLMLLSVYLSKGSRNTEVETLLQQLAAVSSVNVHRKSSIERIYGVKKE